MKEPAKGQRLGAEEARVLIDECGDELGATDRERLETVLDFVEEDGSINLQSILDALFPVHDRKAGQTRVRQLRRHLREAATAAGVDVSLDVDSKKKHDPEERICWFAGRDPAANALTKFSEQVRTAGSEEGRVDQLAVFLPRAEEDRRPLRVFVSLEEEDEVVKKLVEMLRSRMHRDADYSFQLWHRSQRLAGEDRFAEVERNRATSHVHLVFLNYRLLNDDERFRREVTASLDAGDPAPMLIPVLLQPMATQRLDLQGLDDLTTLKPGTEDAAFAEMDAGKRSEFVERVVEELRLRLEARARDAEDGASPWLEARAQAIREAAERFVLEERLADPSDRIDAYRAWGDIDPKGIVRPRGVRAPLKKLPEREASGSAAAGGGEAFDALDFLEVWATTRGERPYFALLGEYGIGKTITCQALSHRIAEARKEDDLPPAIYLDLRGVGKRFAEKEPTLEEIIDRVIERSWSADAGVRGRVSAEQVIDEVRRKGALVIFDGLDEVLVHLELADGQRFTRQLFSILPPRLLAESSDPDETTGTRHRIGKVLISCRTHYFRSVREQVTHFTTEDRDGMKPQLFDGLLLLPFERDQVRTYLRKNLPGRDPDEILELIRTVHNLPELSERPYTLELITSQITEIERARMRGEKVTGVTLYRHMARSWLERDTGKHEWTPDHKLRLMEEVAAELWRRGSRSWPVAEMEDWLVRYLRDSPEMGGHYREGAVEPLKKDFRTATFVVRSADEDDEFRFAHSSLQEFFLASYLLRALQDRRFDAWEMKTPSVETLDFLGQLLEEADDAKLTKALRELLTEFRPQATELAFRYALHAAERGLPSPSLARLELEDADLRDLRLVGPAEGPPLNLFGATFRHCRLGRARFERVDLEEADFEGSDLHRSRFLDSGLASARFADADLAGAIFRRTDLGRSDFQTRMKGGRLHRTQFLQCTSRSAGDEPTTRIAGHPAVPPASDGPSSRLGLGAITVPAGRVQFCAFSSDDRGLVSAGEDGTVRLWDAKSGDELRRLEGHSGRVNACAFSFDDRRLVSASEDGTVRLWDTEFGDELRCLEGHDGGVLSCAFSFDDRRLVSAGHDGTVRLWGVESGDELRRLEGHDGVVHSCAFSSDDRRLVSAGHDGTVRLWNAESGDEVRRLERQGGEVLSCAFSSDDRRLVSAGGGGTVRLWDTESGDELRRLEGHSVGVNGCAFSSDDRRLVSAGWDGTVRLWDAESGAELRRFEGHNGGVISCAFSSDDRRLVSAGWDGTVRLWDAESGAELRRFEGHNGGVFSCAFSSDDRRLVSAGWDGTVRLWDTESGDELHRLEGHKYGVNGCGFSFDDRRLVSAGHDGTVRLWDAESGDELRRLKGHNGWVYSCAFSSDDRRLVSAGEGGTVRLWDAESGDELRRLDGHTSWVTSCAFLSDDRRLVSAGWDGTVRLWDAESGAELRRLEEHSGKVLSCAFSSDDRRLVSAGEDGTLRLWDVESGQELEIRMHHLHNGESATLRTDGSGAVGVSPGAWEWLGWRFVNPATGKADMVPAEYFGPLPLYERYR